MLFDFPRPKLMELQAYLLFYDYHAPKLWGLILLADLPPSESKNIMVETFMKAWRHPDRHTTGEDQVFTWLLSLAYAEGLPYGTLKAVFKRT